MVAHEKSPDALVPLSVVETIEAASKHSWLNATIGYTTNIRASNDPAKGSLWSDHYSECTVADALEAIADPPESRAAAVAAIRKMADGGDEQEAAKKKLPAVIFAGRIEGDRRIEDYFVDHTGLAFFDYEPDSKEACDAAELRDELFADERICAAWVSSSGLGVHGLVRFTSAPMSKQQHTDTYQAAAEAIALDHAGHFDATSDRVRAAFLSHDPDLRFRPNSTAMRLAAERVDTDDSPSASTQAATQDDGYVQPPLADRVAGSIKAIRQGLIGGPYSAGNGTYQSASGITWALSQYVAGDVTVKRVWLDRLESDGRFPTAADRENFARKWDDGQGLQKWGPGAWVNLVKQHVGKGDNPLPKGRRRQLTFGDDKAAYAAIQRGDARERAAALDHLRKGIEARDELTDIVDAAQGEIDRVQRKAQSELRKIEGKLAQAKRDEGLEAQFDRALGQRTTAMAAARVKAVAGITAIRDELMTEKQGLIESLAGPNPTPAALRRAEQKAAELLGDRTERVDAALRRATFLTPTTGDAVAEHRSNLDDLWAEHDDAAHTGSSWERYRRETRPVEWILDGWIPKGTVTILAGAGGVGKSRLVLQLAMGVSVRQSAWGVPPLPLRTKGKGVRVRTLKHRRTRRPLLTCIVNAEDSQDIAAWRIRQIAKTFDKIRADDREPEITTATNNGLGGLADGLGRVDFYQARGALWGPRKGGSEHIETAGELTALGQQVRDYCEQMGVGLLVLDPLANLYSSSENSRAHVAAFLRSWGAWAQRNNVAVLLIAHPPKSGADFSGSSSWAGAARAGMTMRMRWVMLEDGQYTALEGGPTKQQMESDERECRRVPVLELAKRNHSMRQAPIWLVTNHGMGIWAADVATAFDAVKRGGKAKDADHERNGTAGHTDESVPDFAQ